MHRLRGTTAVSLLLAMSLATGSAIAQTDDAGAEAAPAEKEYQLSTITVTAAKSGEQELQSVPLAIQAFNAEDLKTKNINTIDDLISAVPGAYEGQRQSVASRSYNLRGAGGSNANGDSPIGYYLDDVPFIVTNFGIAPPVRFLDMERVEVLRGPQGTLYGQGSSGGVFIFHTRDPNLTEWNGTPNSKLRRPKTPATIISAMLALCPFRSSRTSSRSGSAAAHRKIPAGLTSITALLTARPTAKMPTS